MANPKIFYANLLTAAMVASTTASGYAVANLVDWRSYTRWKPTAAPATLTMDCGSAQAADYGFVYAEAGTYQVRASTDNFSASDVLLGTITLTATGPGLVVFASVSYRYYRITSTTGTPEVGGSSPRAWGTPESQRCREAGRRFIPTRVGNTWSRRGSPAASAVHPHARGEHSMRSVLRDLSGGSSPRAWGTRNRRL